MSIAYICIPLGPTVSFKLGAAFNVKFTVSTLVSLLQDDDKSYAYGLGSSPFDNTKLFLLGVSIGVPFKSVAKACTPR